MHHKCKNIVIIILCLILTGCGLFKKEKLNIEGERIPVLSTREIVTADYSSGDINIILPHPTLNKEWTQTGGNSIHNMGHPESNKNLQKNWSSNFGKGSSSRDYLIATPVIADNIIFTMDTQAVVSAFRQNDGENLWKRKLKPRLRSDKDISLKGAGLAYNHNNIYAVTGFGGVFALEAQTGKIKWEYFTSSPIRTAPTVGGGKVFIQTLDNTIFALNAFNGSEIWRYTSSKEETTKVGAASPAYSEEKDVLIAGFSNGELRALKASTGSPLWSDFLVSSKRTNLLADLNTILASPIIAGDIVIAAGSNNLLVAIDIRSGQRIWEREIGSTNLPWLVGKYLYVMANDARLMCVQADSGKIVWDTKVPAGNDVSDQVGVTYSGPLLSGNRLLVNTSNGYTFYISPYTGKILGYVEIDEGSSLPPITANKQVVITTRDAEIITYQ